MSPAACSYVAYIDTSSQRVDFFHFVDMSFLGVDGIDTPLKRVDKVRLFRHDRLPLAIKTSQ